MERISSKPLNYKLYKNRYLIALYDNNDIPCGVYDNPNQLAKALKRKPINVQSSINKIFQGKCKKISGLIVYFIDYLEQ